MKKFIICFVLSLFVANGCFAYDEFKGVWGCEFGMARDEVESILAKKFNIDIKDLSYEQRSHYKWNEYDDILKENNFITFYSYIPPIDLTYATLPVRSINTAFVDDQLFSIVLIFEPSIKVSEIADIVVEKFGFKFEIRNDGSTLYKLDNVNFYYVFYFPWERSFEFYNHELVNQIGRELRNKVMEGNDF